MKNYLIESMSSYMDKMEKPLLTENFSVKSLKDYINRNISDVAKVKKIESYSHSGMGFKTVTVYLTPEKYNNDGYGYSFDFIFKKHTPEWFYKNVVDTLNHFINEDGGDLDESLTEARNPENDEVNATIRKWANNGRLSKKDKEILDKNGLSIKPDTSLYGDARNKLMTGGTNTQLLKDEILQTHPDYDLAGKLKKKKLDSEDIEANLPRQAYRRGILSYDDFMSQRKDNDYKVSGNQLRSLQPYTQEKRAIKRAKEDRDYYSRGVKSAENRLSDIRNSVKAKHDAKKKNESLSLKEDSKSAIDLYCDDINNEALNGYGRISSLTDAQVKTLLSIAKAVSNKYKVKSLISLSYNTRKDLQNWTKAATQSGVDSKVFNDYAKNVMYAYDELNESLTEDMDTTIVTNIVDWLADHETAWEDCCNYFGADPDSEELYNVDKDELLDWISEHKQLSSDLLRHWGAEWAIQESYKRNRKLKESFNYGDKLMGRAIPKGLYDEICRLLTDYENPNDAITPVTIDDFYDILVDVANYSA